MPRTRTYDSRDGHGEEDESSPFLSVAAVALPPTARASPAAEAKAADRARRQEQRRVDYLVGLLLLLLVVLLWTSSNFLTNTVLTHGYDKPFAVTYFNTSSFLLYLVPFFFLRQKQRRQQHEAVEAQTQRSFEAATAAKAGGAADSDVSLRWWEKLGFRLPDQEEFSLHTAASSQRASYQSISSDENLFAPARAADARAGAPAYSDDSTSSVASDSDAEADADEAAATAEVVPTGRRRRSVRGSAGVAGLAVLNSSVPAVGASSSASASGGSAAEAPAALRGRGPARAFTRNDSAGSALTLTPTSTLELLRSSTFAPRPSSIDGRRPASILSAAGPGVRAGAGTDAAGDAEALEAGRTLTRTDSLAPAAVPLLPLTLRQTCMLSLQFTVVWFLANYSLNAGLGLTSVASGTTLSSASGFFTLALGTAFAVERFTWTKLTAVAVSFSGVALVTWADAGPRLNAAANAILARDVTALAAAAPINAIAGDLLALASAFFYAIYVTLLKLKIGSEDRVSMPLFFGFVGLFSITLLWPFGLVLHLTGVEPFAWPADAMTWAGVAANMAITFTSDFAYLLAMLKSSPLIATVGLSLTIPLAVVGDVLRGSHSGGIQAIIGSAMVLLSFVAIGLSDNALIEQDPEATPDE